MEKNKTLPVMTKALNDRLTQLLKEDKVMEVGKSAKSKMLGYKHQLN